MITRRSFLAAPVALFVGAGERRPVPAEPAPTPFQQVCARYPTVDITTSSDGDCSWWVWVADEHDHSFGVRSFSVDDACRRILEGANDA